MEDIDDATGPYYTEGYRLTIARIKGDPMRLGGPDPAAALARLLARVHREFGDAARPTVEAILRGFEDAESRRPWRAAPPA